MLPPADLAAAVFVVLHRDPDRTSHLQSVLSRRPQLRVVVPRNGDRPEYDFCFVGTPERHFTVGPGLLQIHLVPDHFYRKHNVAALFNSLARNAGSRTIGVGLSGVLKDGTQGLKAIKNAGGMARVQSIEEADFPDMPENAIRQDGPIDLVAPVSELAREICRVAGRTEVAANLPARNSARPLFRGPVCISGPIALVPEAGAAISTSLAFARMGIVATHSSLQ